MSALLRGLTLPISSRTMSVPRWFPNGKQSQFTTNRRPWQDGRRFLKNGGDSNLRQDIGNVGLVHRRECKALLAEMVERRADMDERCLVYDEKTVVELF